MLIVFGVAGCYSFDVYPYYTQLCGFIGLLTYLASCLNALWTCTPFLQDVAMLSSTAHFGAASTVGVVDVYMCQCRAPYAHVPY